MNCYSVSVPKVMVLEAKNIGSRLLHGRLTDRDAETIIILALKCGLEILDKSGVKERIQKKKHIKELERLSKPCKKRKIILEAPHVESVESVCPLISETPKAPEIDKGKDLEIASPKPLHRPHPSAFKRQRLFIESKDIRLPTAPAIAPVNGNGDDSKLHEGFLCSACHNPFYVSSSSEVEEIRNNKARGISPKCPKCR